MAPIVRATVDELTLEPVIDFASFFDAADVSFAAKLLRDNPYPINIAEQNKVMMERNEIKMKAMQQAVQYMRKNMPS